MRRYSVSLVAVCALTLSMLALPSSQASAPNPHLFAVEWSLAITGPTSAEGTFAMTGAIEDSGTLVEEYMLFPDPTSPRAMIGDKVFSGANGDIEARFGAFLYDDGSGVIMSWGMFYVTGGTGAYADMQAVGGAIGEIDVAAGTIECAGNGVTRGN